MTRFWGGWLSVWCAGVGVFGLVLTGAAFAATDAPTRTLFTLAGGNAPDMVPALRFAAALMGAVTLGLGLTFYTAINAAIRLGNDGTALWRGLTVALLIWFIVDSSLSIATGFGLNAVSNTAIMVAFLLPLLVSGVLRRTA